MSIDCMSNSEIFGISKAELKENYFLRQIYHHNTSPNKGRSPYNGKLFDFSFYIDSQISVHRKFKK